ncbi:MAG: cation-translocating P-type ATPase, partial [Devosia sp.]|nr:cation-translocating P-type ATPase [Devosia sp.]
MQAAPIDMELQSGLTSTEARRRLGVFGPNSLPSARPPTLWDRVLRLAREPMLILLLLAAAIYFVLGSMAEGIMLMLFAAFSISLMLIQERRSEGALAALQQLSAPVARVRRDGEDVRLAAADLVPGDLVLLNEGERVPADGVLVAAAHLAIDESLLTGESVPVDKSVSPTEAPPATNRVFGSTLVVNGHGMARVTETGARTETGKLGASLASIVPEETHLQRATGRLVRVFGILALFVCGGLAVYYGLVMGDWLQGILSGIALGMAMLPEEFPVALAIFLAIGSWRLAQAGVLVRRAAAVEALGATTCLC